MTGLNDLYGAAIALPTGPVNDPAAPPPATTQATGPVNTIGALPSATLFPTPAGANDLADFPAALQPPGFPAYLIEPPSPSVSVRSGSSAIFMKVQTMDVSQYRIRNHRTGTVTAFTNSGMPIGVPLRPNDWNLLTFEVQGDLADGVRNLYINEGADKISGSFVIHASRYVPRAVNLVGATWLSINLLDLQLPESTSFLHYWNLSRTNLSAQLIDRLLIVADRGGETFGGLAYSKNPGSPDALRSPAALAALNSLLAKGWTITR